MKIKKLVLLILILLISIGISICSIGKKETKIPHLEGDITPIEAYEMLMVNPEHTFLIDCRTMPEYEFVGHPIMAYNIPYKFWTPEGMRINPDFVKDVLEKFKKTDRLIIICKSGARSHHARNTLIKAGFKHVFNVLGGFEGDKVRNKRSANFGHHRYINGWQHDKLPYTYKLNKKLTYCGCE